MGKGKDWFPGKRLWELELEREDARLRINEATGAKGETEMKLTEAFPSKYVRAEDLKGQHVTVTISHVRMEEMENRDGETELKPVVYFEGKKKGLVLNRTNANAIADLYGDETDDWKGQDIVLHAPMISAFGETKPAVRVLVESEPLEGEPSL